MQIRRKVLKKEEKDEIPIRHADAQSVPVMQNAKADSRRLMETDECEFIIIEKA